MYSYLPNLTFLLSFSTLMTQSRPPRGMTIVDLSIINQCVFVARICLRPFLELNTFALMYAYLYMDLQEFIDSFYGFKNFFANGCAKYLNF